MKSSLWPCGSYPVYINPTWDELVDFAKEQPYDIRICEDDDVILLASGHGNTHNSCMVAYKKATGQRRSFYDFILYKKGATWVVNGMGHIRPNYADEATPAREAIPHIGHERTMNDLLTLLENYDA